MSIKIYFVCVCVIQYINNYNKGITGIQPLKALKRCFLLHFFMFLCCLSKKITIFA